MTKVEELHRQFLLLWKELSFPLKIVVLKLVKLAGKAPIYVPSAKKKQKKTILTVQLSVYLIDSISLPTLQKKFRQ